MFVIQDTSTGLYFHNKGRIIIFEDIEKAKLFYQNFFAWATAELLHQGQPPFEVMMKQQTTEILPYDFTVEEKYIIMFSEIEK
jgi:hypothetical protein